MQRWLNSVQFGLRDRYHGQWKLRPGLPAADPSLKERAFYRLALERAELASGNHSFREPQQVWDIGCRNWSYAPALADFFPRADLVGVELDGGRRYWNLYRRIDLARSYAHQLRASGKNVTALHADFRTVDLSRCRESSVLFCFFFPFVSEHPCLGWGLPEEYSDYARTLAPIIKLRKEAEKGRFALVSLHQGEWEATIARRVYDQLGLAVTDFILTPDDFSGLWPSPFPVYGFHIA